MALHISLDATDASDGGKTTANKFEILDTENLSTSHISYNTQCHISVFGKHKLKVIFETIVTRLKWCACQSFCELVGVGQLVA